MQPPKTLVVALGNPLVGPDGFGAAVLGRVRLLPGFDKAADVLDAHTDLLGELDRLTLYEHVVLIDTLVSDTPKASGPIDVAVYDEAEFSNWSHASPGCHDLSPLLAVKLFRQLHPEAATRITLVGWTVGEVSRAAILSTGAVEAGARAVADLVTGSARNPGYNL